MTAADAILPPAAPPPRWRIPSVLLLLVPGFAFLAILLLAPLARSLGMSVGIGEGAFPNLDPYVRIFTQEFYLRVIWRTVRLSVIVVFLTALIGYPVAYRLQQLAERPKRYIYLLLLAPLLVSHAVISFGWLVILSPNGLVDQALMGLGVTSEPLRLLFTETAIVIGLVQIFLPYMTVAIASSLGNIDPRLTLAAQNLGASPATAFRRIVFPLSIPGLFAGATIVFTLSMSAFATPAFLGGTRVRMMSSLAYQQAIQVLDWPFAAALSFVLLALTTVILLVSTRVLMRSPLGVLLR